MKHDMIQITYPSDVDQIETDLRVIVELINDYTFILDKPFDRQSELPQIILDFKFLSVQGSRGSTP